jgi:agmatinase
MNPAKSYDHLFSPSGRGADNYRALGVVTFLRAPHVAMDVAALKKSKARFAFIGVPFDEYNVGKPGCEDGPHALRMASQEYFPYWFEYRVDLSGSCIDAGDVRMPKVNPKLAHQRIYRAVRDLLAAGLIPIIAGGDHSISIPAAKALSDHIGKRKKMGYIHFGAQLDMADSWAGEKNLSPCAMARITELPNLAAGNVAHLGARNGLNPKDHVDLAKKRDISYNSMFELLDRGVDRVVKEAADRVWNGTDAQYIGFNMNVMDASAAPGVTAAEPGGLESREIMRVADILGKRGSIGIIEVSELSPIFDVSGTTSRLAICVILKILAALYQREGKTVDPAIRRAKE